MTGCTKPCDNLCGNFSSDRDPDYIIILNKVSSIKNILTSNKLLGITWIREENNL